MICRGCRSVFFVSFGKLPTFYRVNVTFDFVNDQRAQGNSRICGLYWIVRYFMMENGRVTIIMQLLKHLNPKSIIGKIFAFIVLLILLILAIRSAINEEGVKSKVDNTIQLMNHQQFENLNGTTKISRYDQYFGVLTTYWIHNKSMTIEMVNGTFSLMDEQLDELFRFMDRCYSIHGCEIYNMTHDNNCVLCSYSIKMRKSEIRLCLDIYKKMSGALLNGFILHYHVLSSMYLMRE